jgi:uncharacterized protein (DUF58 family)
MPETKARTWLDPVALSRLGTLVFKARTVVEGALSGLHRSPVHGSSVEFAEHKEYSPGDEIRHMDWKAYGKFDRFYVKKFEHETELTAYLLVDRSGSMSYKGEGLSKLEYAAYLVASLTYLLIRQQDKVGLLAFGGGEQMYVPPRARANHLHDVLGAIDQMVQQGGKGEAGLPAAIDRVAELAGHRRSLVLLVSDLFDHEVEKVIAGLKRLRVQRHDVAVVQLLDDDERDLPFEGLTLFESLEDDRRLLADPRSIRSMYLDELNGFLGRVRQGCRESDVGHVLVSTRQPLERTLLDLVSTRGRR